MLILVATAAPAANAPCPIPRIHQGMPYAEARKIILQAGFKAQARSGRACPAAEVCRAYPEIQSCSREDYCAMRFSSRRADQLDIFVYGEIKSGSVDVEDFRIVCDASGAAGGGRRRNLRR